MKTYTISDDKLNYKKRFCIGDLFVCKNGVNLFYDNDFVVLIRYIIRPNECLILLNINMPSKTTTFLFPKKQQIIKSNFYSFCKALQKNSLVKLNNGILI